jgi:O-antigen/teichoic acid export membrane protein
MSFAKTTSLATHYLRYATGNVLILVAGLISFPITARTLSSTQFGIMGYWETWAMLLAGILKLGSGDAMMRFYPHGSTPQQLLRYTTNYILFPAILAFSGWLLAMVVTGTLALSGQIDMPSAALLALGQVILTVLVSHILWYAGTREMSAINASVTVIWRWLTLVLTLMAVIYLLPSAVGVFSARLLASTVIAAGLIWWLLKQVQFDIRLFDWAYARQGLAYGFPLALREVSSVVLGFIDRLMLKWMGGSFETVGVYSIGYSLAAYLDQIISAALGQALTPVVNRVYISEGAAAVKVVKRQVLWILVYVAGAMATGLLIAGRDFVLLLASEDKAASVPVFLAAGLCFVVQPVVSTCGMGLLLEKRSKTLFGITAGAALTNSLLNLLLIPQLGVMGAVYATCFSQLGMHVVVFMFCSKDLRCLPQWGAVIKALGASAVTITLAQQVNLFGAESHLVRLIAAAGFVVGVYGLLVFAMDGPLRQLAWSKISRRPATSSL